ncbi:MAG: winged helix DNA-binding domain-containing protein [Ktedonobacteraceae bacterium]
MTNLNIAHQRLHNQFLSQQTFEKPEDVVQWLGAVQAQDYGAAKWALGLRLQNATDDIIEQAFTNGTILRTHVMRPTWHFVTPADIRWMLALTAPRVLATIAYYDRVLELDSASYVKSNAVLVKALQGGKQLTRAELASEFQRAGIACDHLQRLGHIIMHAELDGIICSGARRGKQFTYALLDERAPQTRTLDRDEALAEFVRRYFTSHGPATLQDFVWWSGLTMSDAKAGLEMVSSQLTSEVIEGQTYWFSTSMLSAHDLSETIYLLPNYDEYIVGYTERSAIFDVSHTTKLDARGNVLFNHTIVIDGRVVGTWKRTMKKDMVIITPSLFVSLNEAETRALVAAANRYGEFLGLSVNTTSPRE